MSANSNQRKQELLIHLAETRLNIIDDVECISKRVHHSLGWLVSLKHGFIKKSITTSIGAAIVGIISASLLGKLVLGASHSNTVRASGGVIATGGRFLWGAIMASALPLLKDLFQKTISRKFAHYLDKKSIK
ncbi:MAG: hypothetical protein RSB48_04355 [Akkermansia sp.]